MLQGWPGAYGSIHQSPTRARNVFFAAPPGYFNWAALVDAVVLGYFRVVPRYSPSAACMQSMDESALLLQPLLGFPGIPSKSGE